MPFKIKNTWKDNANDILQDHPNRDVIIKTLFAVLTQIEKNDWKGACHATCAVIHILLNEQGVANDVVLGEAKVMGAFFNHSWIEIDGEIYDVAVGNTLIEGFKSAPVFKTKDVDTKNNTKVQYAVSSGLEDDLPTKFIKSMSVGSYLNLSPIHPTLGLWVAVLDAAKQIGLSLNITHLKIKYTDVNWKIK